LISESYYWKESLLDCANNLERYSKLKDIKPKDLVEIEKDIFISFYSIRKLMDTPKISDSTIELKINLNWSPNLKNVTMLNSHNMHELYDLNDIRVETKNLRFLCNQFVHSYIFEVVIEDGVGLSCCYFTSDRDKNKKIFFITVEVLVHILNLVGNDYPSKLKITRDSKTGELLTEVL